MHEIYVEYIPTADLMRAAKFFHLLRQSFTSYLYGLHLILVRRTVKYILMFNTNVRMKLATAITKPIASRVLRGPLKCY